MAFWWYGKTKQNKTIPKPTVFSFSLRLISSFFNRSELCFVYLKKIEENFQAFLLESTITLPFE